MIKRAASLVGQPTWTPTSASQDGNYRFSRPDKRDNYFITYFRFERKCQILSFSSLFFSQKLVATCPYEVPPCYLLLKISVYFLCVCLN